MRSTLYFSLGVFFAFSLFWPSLSSAAELDCSNFPVLNNTAITLNAGQYFLPSPTSDPEKTSTSVPTLYGVTTCAISAQCSTTTCAGLGYPAVRVVSGQTRVYFFDSYVTSSESCAATNNVVVDKPSAHVAYRVVTATSDTCQPAAPVEPLNCSSGVKDGDELGIDCGGSCLSECTKYCPDGTVEECDYTGDCSCVNTIAPLYNNCPANYQLATRQNGTKICIHFPADSSPVYANSQEDADDSVNNGPVPAGWSTGPLSGTTNDTTTGPVSTERDTNSTSTDNGNGTITETIIDRSTTTINNTTTTTTNTTVIIRDTTTNQPVSTETTTVKETEIVKDAIDNGDGTKTLVKDTTVQESTIDDTNTTTVKPTTNTTTTTTVDAATEAVLAETATTSLAPGVAPGGGGTSPTAGLAPGVPGSAVPGPNNTSVLTKTTTTTKPGLLGPVTTTSTTTTTYDNNTGSVIGESTTIETEKPPEEDPSQFTSGVDAIVLPTEFSAAPYTERMTLFTSRIQSAPIYSTLNSIFHPTMGAGDSSYQIGLGSYGTHDLNLTEYSSVWSMLNTVLQFCAMFVAARIILTNRS